MKRPTAGSRRPASASGFSRLPSLNVRPCCDALDMESGVVVEAGSRAAMAAAVASVARLVEELGGVVALRSGVPDCGVPVPDAASEVDPLQELADACLEGLGVLARVEAATAAAKARMVAAYAEAAAAIEAPPANAYEASAQEMSLVAEVACVLTIGERAAAALLGEAHALTTSLPATLNALESGAIGWQHARIVVEETTGLSPTAGSALEAHFFDPEAPNPARGAAPGDLVAARFRRKVRAWRERHHPESLEIRRAKNIADRRMEYAPDRDGMAWISLYLPGETACALWNRTTALARASRARTKHATLHSCGRTSPLDCCWAVQIRASEKCPLPRLMSSSRSRYSPSSALPMSLPKLTGWARCRRRSHAGSWQTAPTRSIASLWTHATGPRSKSDVPVIGSPNRSSDG